MKLKFALFIGVFALIMPLIAKAQYYNGNYFYNQTPVLTVSKSGNDSALITVSSASPNAQINYFYRHLGDTYWSTVINNIGQTDYNGYFSGNLSLGSDWSNNNTEQYVSVNGTSSNTITVYSNGGNNCGYNGCNVGGLALNPTSLNLNVGQSATVSISSGVYMYAYSPYVSSNSNSNVASASVSNYQLTVYGIASGSTTITVCLSGGSTCGSVYVTVSGGNNNYNQISFSQNNVNLNVGQSQSVSVYSSYSYSNNFYVSSNSNSNVVSASVSGSTLYLSGLMSGSSTITVCLSGYNYGYGNFCGTLYVTVGGGTVGNFTLNPSSVTVNVGQTATVTANFPYIVSGTLYAASNSNSNIASVTFSGSNIYVYGQNPGNTTASICYNSSCNNLYITVTGSGGTNNNNLTFSTGSNVNLYQGQSQQVTVYNYASSYSSYNIYSNSNSGVVSASISGNTMTLNALSSGSSTIMVCQSGYGYNYGYGNYCGTLYVTVGGSGFYGNNLSFTVTSLPQPTVGQYYSQQLQVSGGTSPYNFSLQSGSLPSGLSLSSFGQIFGTTQNTTTAYFTVRANDNYGRSGTYSFTLTPVSSSVLGISYYNNGFLLLDNNTVYIIYKNTKTGFVSKAVFTGLGFNFNQISLGNSSGLVDSGYTVSTSRASHPWGSWVKSGNTVYFVHDSGLIPIPSLDVFQNNGGQDSLVVKANSYDFQRPMLSIMVLNDSRLR